MYQFFHTSTPRIAIDIGFSFPYKKIVKNLFRSYVVKSINYFCKSANKNCFVATLPNVPTTGILEIFA